MRALAFLVIATQVLLNKSTAEDITQLLETVAKADSDAAPAILGRLQETLSSHEASRSLRLRFYASVIKGTKSHRIQQIAISALTETLQLVYEKHSDIPDDLCFLKSLSNVLEQAAADRSGNRELVNAVMHLQGCILPLKVKSTTDLLSPGFQMDLQKHVRSMAFAMQDETVSFDFLS